MDLNLAQRVYIVTGASTGLGFACAKALVDEGCSVVISGRDPERARIAAEKLGPAAMALPADLADPSSPERLVAAAIARFGRLDGAVLSVGGPPAGTALNITDEEWRLAFEAIFIGAVRMIRAVASAATPSGNELPGRSAAINVVLSTSAKVPIPGLSISNGLRPGLAMLVKDFADELGPRGIRINALLPGRIATDRTFTLDARTGSPESVRRRNETAIPLGRYGEPEEFAAMSTFLLSPAASYITGALIPVDGGAIRAL